MDEKLKELISKFNRKLLDAKIAKAEIMDYLDENYDIDVTENIMIIEDNLTWVYGVNVNEIERLISVKGK